MNDKILVESQNGNYYYKILEDGTKIRYCENPIPEYPESIDVKVTNQCDAGCPYCHENSLPAGKIFDVNYATNLLKTLPRSVELAIGGGNPLTVEQDLVYLFHHVHCIINMTLNARHLSNYSTDRCWVTALGVSYDPAYKPLIEQFINENKYLWKRAVIHCIAGVHTPDDIKNALQLSPRVLILGYKNLRRGEDYKNNHPEIEQNLAILRDRLDILLWDGEKFPVNTEYGERVIAFDNLALEQLKISRFYDKKHWDTKFMGKDGEFSMYLDLVEKQYAISSTSLTKYDIEDKSVKQMFAHVRKLAGFKSFGG